MNVESGVKRGSPTGQERSGVDQTPVRREPIPASGRNVTPDIASWNVVGSPVTEVAEDNEVETLTTLMKSFLVGECPDYVKDLLAKAIKERAEARKFANQFRG